MRQLAKRYPRSWAVLVATSLLLVGCSSEESADISQLTIVTTPSVLDQATSMAVSTYVQDQGIEVEIQEHDDSTAVFEALEDETAADHAVVGVVTAQHEATEDAPPEVPDDIHVVSTAPAELGLTAAASTITAAQFRREQQNNDEAEPTGEATPAGSGNACADMTWIPAALPADDIDALTEDLASQGCEPTVESTGVVDDATYKDLSQSLRTEADTVAMLYSIDPMIVDQGLSSLELETGSWPVSNVVAVAHQEIDESLAQQISAVIESIDGDSATTLLRGYHDANVSTSDLRYEADDAIQYWLVEHELLDEDTVTDTSTDKN